MFGRFHKNSSRSSDSCTRDRQVRITEQRKHGSGDEQRNVHIKRYPELVLFYDVHP